VFGAVGGGQAGFNWQSGALVLGAEADFDWSNAKGSITAQCAACPTTTRRSNMMSTGLAPRAHESVTRPTVGSLMSQGDIPSGASLKGTATAGGVSASLTQNATPSGWTIGGGTELALGPNWSAKLEYLYVDLGTVNNTIVVPGAPSLTDSARVQMNVVRAGVNYRF